MAFKRENGNGRNLRMPGAVRRRVTWANVAVTVALVFAMTGGAYAAGKYLITSTKQISPKVLSALKGKAGPAGATGPAGAVGEKGPAGPAGPRGENGAAGASGKNGESVTVAAASGSECSGQGGTKLSNGTGSGNACNGAPGKTGKNGEPWTVGNVLPPEATETGVWAFGPEYINSGRVTNVPISFTVALKAELGATQVHFVTWEEQEAKKVPAACKAKVNGVETEGSLGTPLAAPSNLCVYGSLPTVSIVDAKFVAMNSAAGSPGAGTTGALLQFQIEPEGEPVEHGEAKGSGTWAVTAEP